MRRVEMDTLTKQQRSERMSRVKGKDTKPELLVRSALHRAGLRFRLHRKGLPGRPDIVFPSAKVAVFVHGCFWHRHEGCPRTRTPKTRTQFWEEKFARTMERDERAIRELEALGWRAHVIWECELPGMLERHVELIVALVAKRRP